MNRGAIALMRVRVRPWLTGTLLVGVSVVLGRLVSQGRGSVAFLLAVSAAGVALLLRPWIAALLALAVGVLLPGLMYWLSLPSGFAYVNDLLVGIALVAGVTQAVRRRRLSVNLPVAVWPLVIVASALFASSGGASAVQSAVGHLVPVALMVAVQHIDMDSRAERILLGAVVAGAALQIPVTAIQKAVLYGASVDRIGGTLGRAGTTFMAVMMAGLWCGLLALYTVKGDRRALLWMAASVLPLFFGEAKAGFVLATIGSLAAMGIYVAGKGLANRGAVKSVALAVSPLASLYAVYNFAPWIISGLPGVGARGREFFESRTAAVEYLSGYGSTGQAGRIEALRLVVEGNIAQGRSILGHGVGSLATSNVFGEAGSLQATYLLGWVSSAGRWIYEVGIVGLLAYCFLLLWLAWTAARLFARTPDPAARVLCLGFAGVAVVYLVGGFYTSAWQMDALSMSFWLTAGLVLRENVRTESAWEGT